MNNLLGQLDSCLSGLGLLAQSDWRRMGDRFSGRHAKVDLAEIAMILGACVLAGALIWLIHWASKRRERGLQKPSSPRLFRELCRSHDLDRGQRAALKRLAEAGGINDPPTVFLKPHLFEPEGLPAELADLHQEYEKLAGKLFADLRALEEQQSVAGSEISSSSGKEALEATQPASLSS